jgi:DNA primase
MDVDLDVRVLTLPEELDPFDFLQQRGGADFRQLLTNAVDALDHKLATELTGIDVLRDTHRAAAALENVMQLIARRNEQAVIGRSVLREQQILARLARRFSVDPQTLRGRLAAMRERGRSVARPGDSGDDSERLKPLDPKERELFELLLQDEGLLDDVIEKIPPGHFASESGRAIYEIYCECFHGGRHADFHGIMTQLEDPRLKSLLAELDEQSQQKKERTEMDVRRRLDAVIRAFECCNLEAENRQAVARLSNSLNEEEEAQTLQEIVERARLRQGLSAPTDG